jgi:hypothetical protein
MANAIRLVRQAKEQGKTVIVGGPCATSLPQDMLEAGVDFLVRGEAKPPSRACRRPFGKGKWGVIEEDGKPKMTISPVPRFDLSRSTTMSA